jgi:two-component system CheB/CheR fusion protein
MQKPSDPDSSAAQPEPDSLAPNPSDQFPSDQFPIIGIGASAGGLEPFLELLRAIPTDLGTAVVLVMHQPRHASHLAEVVARGTAMPVVTPADGTDVQPNHVYVAPPGMELTIAQGKLWLFEAPEHSLPIDVFFRSLADDQGERAVGVILSGSASDGAIGIKAIKNEGGTTFAQDSSAAFPQMPRAAVANGADSVLDPAGIAQELIRIGRRALTGTTPRFPEKELAQLFRLVRVSQDVDFTHYKPSTVERRIRRRMAGRKLGTLAEYVALLRNDPDEVEQLYNDILIHVTGFFRDPEVFAVLHDTIVPRMLQQKTAPETIRVWVPGCASGEEVYSLAILLLEAFGDRDFTCPIQIFGTDISLAALERARLGIYPESIAEDVSPQRLRRFFTRVEGGYRVVKAVRDCCVFARQNVTSDPPFSRLELVSCRNVMIYLGSALQRKAMAIFHYALRPEGFLLLGSSETIGSYGELFSVVDRKHKIYQKKPATNRLTVDFDPFVPRQLPTRIVRDEAVDSAAHLFREADRLMLARLPPGVVINEQMEVLQFRGRTSAFLEVPSGAPTFNVMKMAREGLLVELRALIQAARDPHQPVRREGVRVKTDGGWSAVDLEVIPFINQKKERFYLVLFENAGAARDTGGGGASGAAGDAVGPPDDQQLVTRLERELEATREYLQSIIEEQEAMNEELRSANEEIQSSNEELQSTNEELETAKEELQSSNEELTTLNEELQNRNEELAETNSDLVNLLSSIDLPIVMLDNELRIRRFNPRAQRVLNLIPADAGRSIRDLNVSLLVDDLDRLIAGVIENLEVRELKVQDRAGTQYVLRVRPYKTTENKIEGAVMVLMDVGGAGGGG